MVEALLKDGFIGTLVAWDTATGCIPRRTLAQTLIRLEGLRIAQVLNPVRVVHPRRNRVVVSTVWGPYGTPMGAPHTEIGPEQIPLTNVQRVIRALEDGCGGFTFDLCEATGLDHGAVRQALMSLERTGRVGRTHGVERHYRSKLGRPLMRLADVWHVVGDSDQAPKLAPGLAPASRRDVLIRARDGMGDLMAVWHPGVQHA